jgi:hypothetical protein
MDICSQNIESKFTNPTIGRIFVILSGLVLLGTLRKKMDSKESVFREKLLLQTNELRSK